MGKLLSEVVDDTVQDEMTFEDKKVRPLNAKTSARRGQATKLKRATGFKLPAACVEDVACLPDRKLSRARVSHYASCK